MPRGKSGNTLSIVKAAQDIVSPDNPTTVRFLFYKLIMLGVIPENNPSNYEKLVRIITEARVEGELDDSCFTDNKRRLTRISAWKDLTDYKQTIIRSYSRDRWLPQSTGALIACEKDTVATVIQNICDDWQTPLAISSGYFSRPLMCKMAQWLIRQDKEVRIGYVGDADPSGFDMERALRQGNGKKEGLSDILRQQYGEEGEMAWDRVTWERLAITEDDLHSFSGSQLVPVKDTDKRTSGYIRAYGWCAKHDGKFYGTEVEALDQTVLQDRVQDFIQGSIDAEVWSETMESEKQDIETLKGLN